jgi:cell division protease FtsH
MAKKKNDDCWKKDNSRGSCDQDEDKLFGIFPKGQFHFSLWYFVLVFIGLTLINSFFTRSPATEVPFSEFKQLIKDDRIVQVRMTSDAYYGYPADEARTPGSTATIYKSVPVDDPSFVQLLDEEGVSYTAVDESGNQMLILILNWVVPIALLIFVWRYFLKKMGNMGGMGNNVLSFGQNRARIVAESETNTTFSDVAGVEEAKDELVEVVDFLKNPDKYTAIGGKIPKGVLLVGPPGTGKTLLARAVAGEAGVVFFRMSGADFVEMFVGVGAARVRDLFKQARDKAPCIIFIDELDAIGKSRANAMGGNDEREQTLNQLLVEMDGFDATSGVILLAATNRPELLDPALLRPGRFDRQVLVDRPDLKGREAILKIHARLVKLEKEVDLSEIAAATPGFAGSDLANVVNEAALLAVRNGRSKVIMADLHEAIEKAVAGLQKKNRLINPREKKIVAFHETGHALIAAATKGADPVQKISIVPRGFGALGYTLQMPVEDRFLLSQGELVGKLDVLLGGRAAESIIFGEISTGAANDLSKATDLARNMITEYGMSERFRNVALTKRSAAYLGQEAGQFREYSEATQQYIDEEIARMIDNRYEQVLSFLKKKRDVLEKVATILLDEEIIEAKRFLALLKEMDYPLAEGTGETAAQDPGE